MVVWSLLAFTVVGRKNSRKTLRNVRPRPILGSGRLLDEGWPRARFTGGKTELRRFRDIDTANRGVKRRRRRHTRCSAPDS